MGWTNATQPSDIESLLRRPKPAAKYRSRVRIETPPRLGRGDRILLPSVIPAQVQGRHLHNDKYPYDWVSAPRPTPPDASWDHVGDTTHFGRNEIKRKDYGRTAQSNLGAVTRIGSCSLEKSQGRSKRKQCVRSDRL